jgi:site-specific DNA-adenine methylase
MNSVSKIRFDIISNFYLICRDDNLEITKELEKIKKKREKLIKSTDKKFKNIEQESYKKCMDDRRVWEFIY